MWHLLGHVPVRAHHLAMVGGVDDDGVVGHAVVLERLHQPRELLVDTGDAAVIALLRDA